MPQVVVDIAQMQITDNPDDVLVTYSLGSCLGVTVYDPQIQVGGMVHCMLPLSKVDQTKAKARPGMFVDTGVSQLLTTLFKMGARKSRIVINVAGGAHVLNNANNMFKIGERNFTVMRKILWKNGLLMHVTEVGGTNSRTIRLHIASGAFVIKTQGQEAEYGLPRS